MIKITRTGLNIALESCETFGAGSYNVPVTLKTDGTYSNYTTSLKVGWWYRDVEQAKTVKAEANGTFLLPAEALQKEAKIDIAFILENGTYGLVTNQLSVKVVDAPYVGVELKGDSWTDAVEQHVTLFLEEKGGISDEMVQNAVDNYLEINPVNGMTPEEKAQLNQNTEDIEQLKEDIANNGKGLTEAQINALDGMFKVVAYIKEDVSTEYNAFKTAFGLTESGGDSGEDTPTEPSEPTTPTVTLTSITATYSGGNVLVGSELTDLVSNIVVTAKYSDGTSNQVTGYELSGSINEGSNTITVKYQGKSTTFTVVGYVEQEEPSEPTAPVYKLASATTLDGTSGIDTGYILNDVDKDFSILTEYTYTGGDLLFDASKNANLMGPRLSMAGCYFTVGNRIQVNGASDSSGVKLIITHKKGSGTFNTYLINGSMSSIQTNVLTNENYATNQHTVGNTITMKIGSKYTGDANYLEGIIHQFEIYERVLSEDEINTFMNTTNDTPTESNEPVYQLTEAMTFDGTGEAYDTGYAMFSVETHDTFEHSIVFEFTSNNSIGSGAIVFRCGDDKNYLAYESYQYSHWQAQCSQGGRVKTYTDGPQSNAKVVLTKAMNNSESYNIYWVENGSITSSTLSRGTAYYPYNLTNTLELGGNKFNGTIHDFKVYDKVLTEDEIKAYLGV